MSDIETRMRDAITDVEGLLIHGTSGDEALATCSRAYGLKRNALEHRARKALGELQTVKERSIPKAKALASAHGAETAIEAYLVAEPETTYVAWFEERVGRVPTKSELKEFHQRSAEFFLRDIKFEI